ncbi:C2h2 finger-containing protein [Coleophoma crateriformis]|uniref:C2h2 finger-containing protein n=1 Tax=Coleophoma crateriformis TaxID=565419 RepID=A0A3D8T128_9HELO|nr:C2h2 finger-containing protein [Coleophoma crateriformis]
MTSVLAAHTVPFPKPSIIGQMDSGSMAQIQDSTIQRRREVKMERQEVKMDDKSRGRQWSRPKEESVDEGAEASAEEAHEGHSSGPESGPTRKRRRSRKGLDKKFECPTEGCGKSYSRAEHLHKERHFAKGSQLSRKDSQLRRDSEANENGSTLEYTSSSPEIMRPNIASSKPHPGKAQYQSPREINTSPFSPSAISSAGNYTSMNASTKMETSGQAGTFRRSHSDSIPRNNDSQQYTHGDRQQRHASFGVSDAKTADFSKPALQAAMDTYGLPSAANAHSYSDSHPSPQQVFVSQQNFTPFSLPPSGFTTAPTNAIPTRDVEPSYPTSMSLDYPNQQSGPDMMLLDQMNAPNTMPVFGGDSYNRSPFGVSEDFIAYLFNNPQVDIGMGHLSQQGFPNYTDTNSQILAYYANDANLGGLFSPGQMQQPHPMALTSLLDTSLPETVISEEKSQAIVDFIKERFNETGHSPVARQKEALLEGDRSEGNHMLSRKMMQTYIGSYWYKFSEQIPILHKPTFSPDRTPNLLLIAMMAIGASCLDKMHGHEVTQAGAELSNFLAWHLRWEIFSDYHFRPPAKLWVFQALLLLELYEKMYSTRTLHERSNIHHATTIALMRRGSSLIGRSALDSPPSVRDDKQGANESRHSSESGANTPDEWWNHWITNEATRRAAFAAFVIDSTHATMFGHSTSMVAHEMRLPLPCDESLWSATNSAEVARIEAGLHANGVKPVSFIEGLKRTLNGQEVRTNSFGRTILMAGLLSVSWHMHQRDVQVSTLGVSQALGGRDRWRGTLTKAFDLWKQDFDRSLARTSDIHGPYAYSRDKDENVVFESRTVLHHLAHMAMHVDIINCQIFARATRVLGRTIGSQDLSTAQRHMKDVWAPTAKARDATYYALQFLRITLLPEGTEPQKARQYDHIDPPFEYSAREDVLLNRPWVMYFAALIVWSYAFALEGPTTAPTPGPYDFDAQVRDMRHYLRNMANVHSPEDLKHMHGFNGCTGLLMVLRSVFEKTRWELLHEAALLLTNCIQLIGSPAS